MEGDVIDGLKPPENPHSYGQFGGTEEFMRQQAEYNAKVERDKDIDRLCMLAAGLSNDPYYSNKIDREDIPRAIASNAWCLLEEIKARVK